MMKYLVVLVVILFEVLRVLANQTDTEDNRQTSAKPQTSAESLDFNEDDWDDDSDEEIDNPYPRPPSRPHPERPGGPQWPKPIPDDPLDDSDDESGDWSKPDQSYPPSNPEHEPNHPHPPHRPRPPHRPPLPEIPWPGAEPEGEWNPIIITTQKPRPEHPWPEHPIGESTSEHHHRPRPTRPRPWPEPEPERPDNTNSTYNNWLA